MEKTINLVHVMHETSGDYFAKGSIGGLLEGLCTTAAYTSTVHRSVIVQPYRPNRHGTGSPFGPNSERIVGPGSSTTDSPYQEPLRRVERQYGVSILYGKARVHPPATGTDTEIEYLAIDERKAALQPVNTFKAGLYDEFGIDSYLFESNDDYDRYVKLAPAAMAALRALELPDPSHPAVLLAHNHPGIPTALAALMDPLMAFKTLFVAHEVPTSGRIILDSPGHETQFFPALRWGLREEYYAEELFGSQNDDYRTPLVSRAWRCDGILAMGHNVPDELRFLGTRFQSAPIHLGLPGLRPSAVSREQKLAARQRLTDYAETLIGYRPTFLLAHQCPFRPEQGIWRDLRVLYHLEQLLAEKNETAVFFLHSTDQPPRRPDVIGEMEANWNWPVDHRRDGGDLSEQEAAFYPFIEEYNNRCHNVKIIFVNQHGWDTRACGRRMPETMSPEDLHLGCHGQLDQAIYTPCHTAALKGLTHGGLCVLTATSGLLQALQQPDNHLLPKTIIPADYTNNDYYPLDRRSIMLIGQRQRDGIEEHVSRYIAEELTERLPRNNDEDRELMHIGHETAGRLDWETVARETIIPAILAAYEHPRDFMPQRYRANPMV